MKIRLTISLQTRFILYLIFVHLLFAGIAIYLLKTERIWLLAVEAVFIASLAIGIKLIRNLFGTLELLNTGTQFIEDNDFTSRFREIGQLEMDRLIGVYNRMADHLREERTRMQEQNYFLEKVLNASPSGIITFDFDGRIAMVNPVAIRMLACESSQLLGKQLDELNTPFARALSQIKLGESQLVALAGRRRVKCQRSQFLDRGFTRDFILIEEFTEELRQAEKTAYEKVIRLMSHEVNNSVGSANSLLHSCLHYSDQLRADDQSDFETAIKVVIGRTDHLNSFMRNFADVFRLRAPHLQDIDLTKLLEEMSTLFKSELEKRKIELRWDVREHPAVIKLDRQQMEQVFVNVLKNAIEAIGDSGSITIRLGNLAGRAYAMIEDTGSGISASAHANLFTPFFSTKENGQGIGLTLVQEILDQHGFQFSLESPPSGPTQFTIYF